MNYYRMWMKFIKPIILILILSADSCIDTFNYIDDSYTAPCRVIVKIDACGITDIGNNLSWLHDLIVTSATDQTGDYKGKIWCKQYNGVDYIVTDMTLGSGNLGYHTYTCTGEPTIVDDTGFYNSFTQKDIVWISFCITPGTGV
jgi:hypothetical protein